MNLVTLIYHTSWGARRQRAINPARIARVHFALGKDGGYDKVTVESEVIYPTSGAPVPLFELMCEPGRGERVFKDLVEGINDNQSGYVVLHNFDPHKEVAK
jgi:hypothetical protein